MSIVLRVVNNRGKVIPLPVPVAMIRRVEEITARLCRVWITDRASWTVKGSAQHINQQIRAARNVAS